MLLDAFTPLFIIYHLLYIYYLLSGIAGGLAYTDSLVSADPVGLS